MPHLSESLNERLRHVPTALFPIALGLAGMGGALRAASAVLGQPPIDVVGTAFVIAAALVLVLDTALYTAKLVRARADARAEFQDATSANLVAPAFMAAMVIGSQFALVNRIGLWLWALAAIGHLALLLRFVGRWITDEFAPDALNPTWFLPAAGIMTGSMTAPASVPTQAVLALFGAGLAIWLILLPLVFRRVVFEPALPRKLRPTLFILAAPFGLAAGSVLRLGQPDGTVYAAPLAYGGAFLIVALLARPRFLGQAGVCLSWWATTFPIATVAASLLRVSTGELNSLPGALGLILVALAIVCVLLALSATARLAWSSCFGATCGIAAEVAAMKGDSLRPAA